MRLFGIILAAAVVTIAPIAVIGTKYSDGIFTDNTYNKSLDYDAGKQITNEVSGLTWSQTECVADKCKVTVSMDIDVDNLQFRVFRPANNTELVTELQQDQNTWTAEYKYTGKGWYIYRLDYTADGVLASGEKSYLAKNSPALGQIE